MRRMAMVIALVGLLGACGQDRMGGGGSGPAPERAQAPRAAGADAGGGSASAGSTGGETAVTLEAPGVGPHIIKTADVRVRIENGALGEAMGGATDVAARHGGYVISSTRAGHDARTGSVTIRVPSERFEAALSELRGLGRVDREHVGGEDVGQEFVDLEARLRNLEAQEAVLLRLFDDAESVADTIRIQNELSRVQLDIEQHEGRLRYLRDQTAFGTITVALSETGAGAPGTFQRAWTLAVRGVVSVAAGLVVVAGYALPLALLAGIALLVVRRLRRRPVPEGA